MKGRDHKVMTQACVAIDPAIAETALRTIQSDPGRFTMKTALAALAFATFAFAPSAFAMDKMACDDDSMMKVEMMMKEHKGDKAMADEAMKENEMAAMSKKEGKMEDCAMHLNMAAEKLMK
jgi:hypothetical protein